MENLHLFFFIPDWKIHKYFGLMNPVIFRIHQSVTKIRLLDLSIRKSTSCFQNKVKVSFGIYKIVGCRKKNVGVQEEEANI